ncbi:MAG: hypothetical protein J6K88_02335 [Oscillospiraceae bacterium]|nr:hypothetical protein [Oscillospiraceae bacterium]
MNYSKDELRQKKEDAIKEAEDMSRKNAPPKEGTMQNEARGLFSFFDSDSILIFLLIMLLTKEKSNTEIILALLYILI